MPSASSAASQLGVSPTLAAKVLEQMGRGSDTMLAHVNPREMAMLLRSGGSGKRNPKTGLVEFDGGGGADSNAGNYGGPLTLSPQGPTINIGGVAYDPTTATPAQTALVDSYTPAYNPASYGGQAPVVNLQSGTLPIDPSLMAAQGAFTASTSNNPGGGVTGSFFDPETNPQGVAYPGNPYYTTNDAGNAVFTPQGQAAYDAWQNQQTQFLAENARGISRGIGGFLSTPLGGLSVLGFPLALGGAAEALGAVGGATLGGGTGAADVAATGLDATIPASMESAELASDPTAFSAATAAGGAAGTTAADTASTLGAVAPAADVSGDTAPFIGATWTQPATTASAVPSDVAAAAPATVSQAPVVPGGVSAASVTPGAAGGDLSLGGSQGGLIANTINAGEAVPGGDAAASLSGTSPSIWSQIGSALGLGGGGTGAAGAAGGGGGALSSIVNSPLVKLAGAAASGIGLINDVNKSNSANPIPGMSNVQQIAQQSQTQGQILQNYLNTGTLPPAVQASVDQATQDGITAIKNRYAAMGIAPGSSQETQDIARLQQNAVVQGATLADQLTQQGIGLTELSAQLYQSLVGYNAQLNQQTGQAITNLATALAGGGTTLKLAS